MKKLLILIITLCSLIFSGCLKDNINNKLSGIASVTFVNARPDISTALLNLSNTTISYNNDQAQVYYQSFLEYGLGAGNQPITIVSQDDTTTNIYKGNMSLKNTGIYSLYMFGTAQNPQTMFMEDHISTYKDSVAGVRFINLSPDSPPLNIVVQGSNQTAFSNLAYKQITAFQTYPATSAVTNNGGYTFNVVDGSGNVLTSFSWNSYRLFNNTTLVIAGQVTDNSINVFSVNNYY